MSKRLKKHHAPHHAASASLRAAAPVVRQRNWRFAIGAALLIFGVGPMFLFPWYSAEDCPDVERTAYREMNLAVRPTDVHGKLEYCAFPYHYEGRSLTAVYDPTPWSDFCGPTSEAVQARVDEFRKPAQDTLHQCQLRYGDAVRKSLHHPLNLFGGS
jgi:hypothetical protein